MYLYNGDERRINFKWRYENIPKNENKNKTKKTKLKPNMENGNWKNMETTVWKREEKKND